MVEKECKSVLVADDDACNRKLMVNLLHVDGYEVGYTDSGTGVLDVVARDAPDILLLDLTLPDMDGFEVVRRLKANPAGNGIQIVMIIALDDGVSRACLASAGVSHVLTKPVNRWQLKVCLEGLTESAVQRGETMMPQGMDDGLMRHHLSADACARSSAFLNRTARDVSGETYFFRDQGQFDLLRLQLLPELIKLRRDSKTLRLWSAGCSSGEEAYSLAMLVDMVLPDRDKWNILILGTDIDERALTKARRGCYGQWSFRMVPPTLQQRYFRCNDDEWLLDERIRSMVLFQTGDLIANALPNEQCRDMDLILCRNVFIYFAAAEVAAVAGKLAAVLKEGGYLMTAHTELISHDVRNLQNKLFAEGVVYQRATSAPVAEIPQPVPVALPPATAKRTPCVTPSIIVPSVEDLLASARALADRGEYEQAVQVCQQVLAITPLAPEPYFLLAQMAQLMGDFEQARHLLDKTLYLDQRSVAATLELAALYERAEKLPRARALRCAALEIVRELPGNAVIEPYETTAAEMLQWLAQ